MSRSREREKEPVFPSSPGKVLPVEDTYKDYFLQYASYVITDRAIPDIEDGLKPVQRRILHSLWENEDGRYNKVANIVGHCMKYHPHGDASIFSAMVGLAQKGLLIDTQGNWGDPVTNDPPAAARYIEARLTEFAREVVFAPHLTTYKLSYDGRNKEPVTLPVRFPLLLALGTEGIAVGLTTRILPHNFIELLEAQKAYFRGKEFQLYPDFPTGGLLDVSDYQDGATGSRLKVRARLEQGDGKSIVIREIPYGTSTESLIDSIIKASEKGQIKVSNIQDNSAAKIEIVVTFQRGVDMDKAQDALYAFTDCETSLSSNCMVIRSGHPEALSVRELLIESADRTLSLLEKDLKIRLARLQRDWHLRSLVQIFIEHRIYRRIEKAETWENVLSEIDQGLKPHTGSLRQPVTREDVIYLTEVKIRRISAWDSAKARDELKKIDSEIAEIQYNLEHITGFTISYLDQLLEKYGSGRERRTELTAFDSVKAAAVVERTDKLYMEPRAGFIGTDLKDGIEIGSCSPLDHVMVVLENGSLVCTKVADRRYVGERIIYAQVYRPADRGQVFNMVYTDLKSGRTYAKRFTVGGYTLDRHYPLGRTKQTRVHFLSSGPDTFVHIRLRKKPRIKTDLYVRFDELLVKGRNANGVTVTQHTVSSVREISENVYCNRQDLDPNDLPPPVDTGDRINGSGDRQGGLFDGGEDD